MAHFTEPHTVETVGIRHCACMCTDCIAKDGTCICPDCELCVPELRAARKEASDGA